MSSVPVALLAGAIAVLGLTSDARADKSLRAYGHAPERHYDEEPDEGRPEGVQVFVGKPHFYDGYTPYYGPYVYSPLGALAGRRMVGPNYRGDPADCRRWTWAHGRTHKGEWVCAEW